METAIVIRDYGGSNVLKPKEIKVGAPAAGELRIRQTGIGVNFHDVYVRSGLYRTLSLPGIPGCEAVGVIEDVGHGVDGFSVGDRIAYVTGTYGAYATHRLLDANLALNVPDEVPDALVATNLLRAMTVDMLISQVTRIKQGDTILVQAAAGGVGRLLCQWASHLGATVIGTVGSDEKAEQAKAAGCVHTILYRQVSVVDAVRDLTDGQGVDVAYDSVGANTFYGSLECLKPKAHMVNFGQSSGPVKPLEMPQLAAKSLTVTRPILFHYIAERKTYQRMAASVFDAFAANTLDGASPKAFPLTEAFATHDALEGGNGGGTLMLVP